ncbi:hypothetical protein AFE_1195 [Acidithiobacillus ferrooxidans ATCC 23270]|uniref:Uncharacterized protein n=1 Tax=Acidithiobacillus ferrooxidans (strain ATCC 23270 / DSM 14882 / CIP 104768 / NCIMB 8455) TaxID=243159 RepID=B7J8M8_ACIF2|nr:hypothetical protein AFE_1195 [Acidithiobacillus ferrooxidans ATCC 23270]
MNFSELRMNTRQGDIIASQAWHTENRMDCCERYGLLSATPKNIRAIQSGFIMI